MVAVPEDYGGRLLDSRLNQIQNQLNRLEDDINRIDVQLDTEYKERGELILSLTSRAAVLETWRGTLTSEMAKEGTSREWLGSTIVAIVAVVIAGVALALTFVR